MKWISLFWVIVLLASLPALTGCEELNRRRLAEVIGADHNRTGSIDVSDYYRGPASLEKYVLKFIDDGVLQGVDVTYDMVRPKLEIRIGSLDDYGSSIVGLCRRGRDYRQVTLDPDFWDVVSETQRELLLHHELGHCVLYRGHRSARLDSGIFASIMNPIVIPSSSYLKNYDYYQEELFGWGALSDLEDPDQEVTHICGPRQPTMAAGG